MSDCTLQRMPISQSQLACTYLIMDVCAPLALLRFAQRLFTTFGTLQVARVTHALAHVDHAANPRIPLRAYAQMAATMMRIQSKTPLPIIGHILAGRLLTWDLRYIIRLGTYRSTAHQYNTSAIEITLPITTLMQKRHWNERA